MSRRVVVRTRSNVDPLPETSSSLVLRSDFSDEAAWTSVCEAIQRPVGDFMAYIDFLSDPQYADASIDDIVAAAAAGPYRSYVFVVDRATLSSPEHAVLVVDLTDQPGRTFQGDTGRDVGRGEQLVPCEHGLS